MSTSVAVRDVAYTVPTSGDVDYATQLLDLYDALAAATYDAVEALHVVGDMGEPAFENGWVNRASGENAVSFYKDPFGVVHLDGAVKDGTPDVVFTLPVGYRPAGAMKFPGVTSGGIGIIKVDVGGTVSAQTVTSFIYLSGITFRV